MPTLPPEPDAQSRQPHEARELAESFGSVAELYDRARPSYPDALIEAIVESAPGRDFLDVGCGTGISSRQFQAAGCRVLGVDVDERMAAYARGTGVEVEVSPFESWDSAGRTFAAVVAGMTWHWIDPKAGAAKAADVLRPGGRLAVFWYVLRPPHELAESFGAIFRDTLPDRAASSRVAASPLGAYERFIDGAAKGLASTGRFENLDRPKFPWSRAYTRDEWLDQVRTGGNAKQLAETGKLDEILSRFGAAIDAVGGSFTIDSTAVALTATRT